MRLAYGLIILLLVLLAIGAYQYWNLQKSVENKGQEQCIAQGGGWDFAKNSCDLKAKEHCATQGYEWDEEGGRCLITDYYL